MTGSSDTGFVSEGADSPSPRRRAQRSLLLRALWWYAFALCVIALLTSAGIYPFLCLLVVVPLAMVFELSASAKWIVAAAIAAVSITALVHARRRGRLTWGAARAWLLQFAVLIGTTLVLAWSPIPMRIAFEFARSDLDDLREASLESDSVWHEAGVYEVQRSWSGDPAVRFFESRNGWIMLPNVNPVYGFAYKPDTLDVPWPDRVLEDRRHLGSGWYRIGVDHRHDGQR